MRFSATNSDTQVKDSFLWVVLMIPANVLNHGLDSVLKWSTKESNFIALKGGRKLGASMWGYLAKWAWIFKR